MVHSVLVLSLYSLIHERRPFPYPQSAVHQGKARISSSLCTQMPLMMLLAGVVGRLERLRHGLCNIRGYELLYT